MHYVSGNVCADATFLVHFQGTTSAYSSINFSPSGDRLASVGNYPDYLLTVWDWQNEKIMLRCKAFSQEVFRVEFSPNVEVSTLYPPIPPPDQT